MNNPLSDFLYDLAVQDGRRVKFWLGTHMAQWLWNGQIDSPLFVSDRRLKAYTNYRPSRVEWCLDKACHHLRATGRYDKYTTGQPSRLQLQQRA